MTQGRTRLLLLIITLGAFFGPLLTVIAIENSRKIQKALEKQQSAIQARKEIETARYQYYLEIANRRENLQEAMAEAKAQYEDLLKKQPELVKAGQHEVTQTTIKPVVTQKTVEVPTPTITIAPKSSTKTKTS